MTRKFFVMFCLCIYTLTIHAQNKLSIDKVYSVYLRNTGTITENNQIKGYFFLYQSDKIDKHTNEYTLQILDQNLNKVKDIKFEDSKKLNLLEAAYNGSSLSFLFKNDDSKTLDMKVYDIDGNLKFVYSREYDKRTEDLMERYITLHTDEGTNQNVFNVGEQGYVSVLPLRDGKQRTYEVDYYDSETKKQWAYIPEDDDEHYAMAEFLGSTDSLIILEVMKKNRLLSSKVSAHLIGINFVTKKKVFDIDSEGDAYKFSASNVAVVKGTDKFLVLGSYFDKNDNIAKDFSKGLAIYQVNTKGQVISKTYNSWSEDFAKYLPANRKGKVDALGYIYIHKLIQTPENKFFVVGEGYKRQANASGIALTALGAALGGVHTSVGVTKIVVTDMAIMEFNDQFKITNATIYDKANNNAIANGMSDYNSQHLLAIYLKSAGLFDYEFTTGDADNSNFSVCYGDWVRSSEYKGQTFNSIHYDGAKFSTDKIQLKSGATRMRVLPAKAGSVMILEYFKKDKRVDLHLEKLG